VLAATLHNFDVSKRWVLITNMAGENLYWGNNPFPDVRLSVQGYWDIREVDLNIPGRLLVQGLRQRSGADSIDGAFMAGAIDFVKSEPLHALGEVGTKVWRFFSNYEIPRDRDFGWCRPHNPFLQLPMIPFALLLGLAAVGAWKAKRETAVLFLLPCLAAFVTEVAFFNASRYRALAIPFLLPIAVPGAVALVKGAYEGVWKSVIPGVALVTLLNFAGDHAVPRSEQVRHEAVALFKAAMLESYADDNGNWAWLSLDRFRTRLAESRRIDPDNLDAFFVEQKLLIHNGDFEMADRNIRDRRARCRPGEWLCEDVCRSLRQLYSTGE
jgi:hypothetical protein